MNSKVYNVDEAANLRRALAKLRKRHPELRLCQVLSIAAHKAGWANEDLFYCPDSTILQGLELLAEQPESEENKNGSIYSDKNC